MTNLEAFFERGFSPVKSMTRNELKVEAETWRNIWSWIDPELQGWLKKLGSEIALKGRDYKTMVGYLGQPHVIVDALEINWIDREYNYFKKEATYMNKTTQVRINQLADFSFIHGKEVKQEEYSGTPVEEEAQEMLEPEELEGE